MDHLYESSERHTVSGKQPHDAEESRGLLTQGNPSKSSGARWVQTDKATHELWGSLSKSSPRAAALMHYLVAQMGHDDAVVASWATLASISGMSVATVRRAIADLRAERWIEVVQIGGKGAANAIVINSRVAWVQGRDKLHYARFSASVLARADEQDRIETDKLNALPPIYLGEKQLPHGPGEPPPSQPTIEGMAPDLPVRCPPLTREKK